MWNNYYKNNQTEATQYSIAKEKFMLLVIWIATYHKNSTANAEQRYMRVGNNQAV